MPRLNVSKRLAHLLLLLPAAGCSFRPPSQHPEMEIPANFKEDKTWKLASPGDTVPRGAWWSIFHDSELDALLRGVETGNQSLEAAGARLEQAAALLKSAKLAFLPTATGNASVTRSSNSSRTGGGSGFLQNSGASISNVQSLSGDLSWEIDLWGRLRHEARAAYADTQAAAADVQSTLLSLQAQAATAYFSLRGLDAERKLLDDQIASYERSLKMTRNRYAQGVAGKTDVAQAETLLAATRAAAIELGVQRAAFEHALAVLTGRAPADYALGKKTLAAKVPGVPGAAPSTLLERRPDIGAAERRVAAANERIGSARAAFFPALTLSANGGWRGITDLISLPNRYWALGPEVVAPILDGGQRIAAKRRADAEHHEITANYRQAVLTAFQETEDALATLRILAAEAVAQAEAVRAGRESERIAINQYQQGFTSFLEVAIAQNAALNAERNALNIQVRRLNAAVALIKAMGGKW